MSTATVGNLLSTDAAIAANVRAEVARTLVSQRRIAEAVGVSQPGISARLRGHVPFKASELWVIADLLGVDVAKLLVRPEGFEPPTF